jgi:hypothetical protein
MWCFMFNLLMYTRFLCLDEFHSLFNLILILKFRKIIFEPLLGASSTRPKQSSSYFCNWNFYCSGLGGFFLICIVGDGIKVHSTLRPPNGLLCQPRVIMLEKSVEWLAGETKVLVENLPQCRFVHHKPHMLCPDANPGRRGGKPVTYRLSYGTALTVY